MMESKRIEVIQQYIDCYNNYDVAGMLSFLTNDVEFENVSAGSITASSTGKAEFETLAQQSCAIFEKREQKILSVIEDVDQIKVEISYSAVFANDLPNGILAGQKMELNGRSTFVFFEGKICRIIDES